MTADRLDALDDVLTGLVIGEIDQEMLGSLHGGSVAFGRIIGFDLFPDGVCPKIKHLFRETRLELGEFEHGNGIRILTGLEQAFAVDVPCRQIVFILLPGDSGAGERILHVAFPEIKFGKIEID